MPIWNSPPTVEKLNSLNASSMAGKLGIEFTEVGPDFLTAKMPVDARTLQPFGIMHGGASCVLAETIASVAANYCIDVTLYHCVGLEINTSHLRQVQNGWVQGKAVALHLGRTTQCWEITIHDELGKLISVTRLRMAVLNK